MWKQVAGSTYPTQSSVLQFMIHVRESTDCNTDDQMDRRCLQLASTCFKVHPASLLHHSRHLLAPYLATAAHVLTVCACLCA
jgi:hypothetical protein